MHTIFSSQFIWEVFLSCSNLEVPIFHLKNPALQDSYRFLIRIANLFRNYLICLNCSTIKWQSQSAENNSPTISPTSQPSACVIFCIPYTHTMPRKKIKLLVFCTTQNVEKGRYFANCFYGENRISEV